MEGMWGGRQPEKLHFYGFWKDRVLSVQKKRVTFDGNLGWFPEIN